MPDNAARLRALHEELAGRTVTAHSTDETVSAVVDGNGALVAIRVAPGTIRLGRPHAIGPAVVEALGRARAVAGAHVRERVAAILNPAPEKPQAPQPKPARRPRRTEDQPDELFTGLWG